jgi:hypothetical protein
MVAHPVVARKPILCLNMPNGRPYHTVADVIQRLPSPQQRSFHVQYVTRPMT